MKEPREDDERLSALLEGRVEGSQREDLLAHLAAADDDYEVFTDTAAVLRALEEEDARARKPLPPSMRKKGWRVPSMRTAMVVAGTMVLLLAVGLALRGRAASSGYDPLELAMRANPAGRLSAEWSAWAPRGTVRGPRRGTSDEARAVMAGAMLVDLSAAVQARDEAQTQLLARRVGREFEPGASAGTPLRRIEARPDAPVNLLNEWVAEATKRLARLGREPLELGAWAEAARLAATEENTAFFQDGGSDRMLRRAERLARGDEAAVAAVAQVRVALPRSGTTNWDALGTSLEAMLSRLVN